MIRKLALATVLTVLAVPAFAEDCAVTIEGTDLMTKMRDKPRTFSAGKDSAGRL
ncbi:MAG: hypothetical protein M0Q29_11915 [Thiopseudomonas sp.]|nr:hypothetical protein [Thiopseudomonas sp.]